MCGSTTQTKDVTRTPQESGAGAVTLPSFMTDLIPTLSNFLKTAIGDREFPYAVPEKQLKSAMSTMGTTMFQSIMKSVNEPADLFKIDVNGYMDAAWQGLIDYGANYDASKVISKPQRTAFQEYAPDLKKRFTNLAEGKGEAMATSEADFRQSLKEVEAKTASAIEASNRLAGSNPMLRKSNQMKIMVARGGWEQTARDAELTRRADMELKSEFFGTSGLLDLAKTAVAEETNFNQQTMAAEQLAASLTMQAKGIEAGALQGKQGLDVSKIGMMQEEEQRRLANLLTGYNAAEKTYQYGKDYPLRALTGANQFLGVGANVYNADISRYAGGSTSYYPTSSGGAGIGALGGMGAGALAGGLLALPTGGLSVPMGALLGLGIGGGAGSIAGSYF